MSRMRVEVAAIGTGIKAFSTADAYNLPHGGATMTRGDKFLVQVQEDVFDDYRLK